MDFNDLYHLLGLGGLLGSAAIWVVGLYLTGRERRISLAGEALAGALTTLLVPLYMAISGGRLALWLALPLGCLGLAAGALRGFTLPLRVVDGGRIVGRQSRLLLLFWGGALLLQQLATFSGSAALVTLALPLLLFATMAQVAVHGILLLRRLLRLGDWLVPAPT
ncbi:MAG: hypothetical protein KDE09_02370 [Anaerolineales bacterium]|nr:hypothetical protein [Anaerolineales bacterium]MCB0016602.1 hypothetical protein [Anaerolineales bacterium]